MNKEELHKFNNRFNSFVLAFEQLKKDQHRNSIDKSITINEVHLIDLEVFLNGNFQRRTTAQ